MSERWWRAQWSIGIYRGSDPFDLRPIAGLSYPMLSGDDVTDVPAAFVADPFLVRDCKAWHLFFEVWNRASARGEIGHATSTDGLCWSYRKVVLAEPFHLSYPQVFRCEDDFFMVPESYDGNAVRLYRADPFPNRWVVDTRLLEGSFVDSSLFRYDGRWWMFTHRGGGSGLEIYSADELRGPWTIHPRSPLYEGNRSVVRSGGRPGRFGDRLIRFAQDGVPSYGYCVRAMEIHRLSEGAFEEHPVSPAPILRASRRGWNAIAMHHVDPHPCDSGGWVAAVDGARLALC